MNQRPRLQLLEGSQGRDIFVYPAFGPGTYREVTEKINSRGREIPNSFQIANLLNSAYINKHRFIEENSAVREAMAQSALWIYNLNIWTQRGVYVLQDDQALGLIEGITIRELNSKLHKSYNYKGVHFSNGGTVRFAPKETYELGKSIKKLSNDGFLIASFGSNGATKLEEILQKSNLVNHFTTFGFDISKEEGAIQTLSLISCFERGLVLHGNITSPSETGVTFALKST